MYWCLDALLSRTQSSMDSQLSPLPSSPPPPHLTEGRGFLEARFVCFLPWKRSVTGNVSPALGDKIRVRQGCVKGSNLYRTLTSMCTHALCCSENTCKPRALFGFCFCFQSIVTTLLSCLRARVAMVLRWHSLVGHRPSTDCGDGGDLVHAKQ